MHAYELEPLDTLFFRDARPMQPGAGSGGHGATWPLPSILHEGLRANLLRFSGEPWKKPRTVTVRRANGEVRRKTVQTTRFQSLRTLGPFPTRNGTLYVPTPRDLAPMAASDGGAGTANGLSPRPTDGTANWPASWLRGVSSDSPPAKADWPEWVPLDWFLRYLSESPPWPAPVNDDASRLYDAEPRIGVRIDSETNRAKDGQLYASEHLRLRDNVRLWFQAGLGQHERTTCGSGGPIAALAGRFMTLGGEGRVVRLTTASNPDPFSVLPKPKGLFIKWILVTPAVFRGGWRPGWVDESSGRVMLPATPRNEAKIGTRLQRRAHLHDAEPIRAHLVSVCCGKPEWFSGWDQGTGSPKPTMQAVPSGSVYYFKAEDENSAAQLVEALHGRVRSDFFGEKGMGCGFCGDWPENL